MKQRILLVEDDENLGNILKEYLELKDFDITHCANGEAGKRAFENHSFDLCLLDVMLPKMDGFSLGKFIREKNQEIPIIFLTAKSQKEDRLEGLTIGADDYVTKPFSIEELLLRIKAILKRTHAHLVPDQFQNEYKVGLYSFDTEQRTLHFNGDDRQLTHKESELLKLLCNSQGMVVRRSDALKKIWGDDNYFNGRSMDVFVTRLRKYLKDDESVEIINVHGMGFKLLVHQSKTV